MKKTQSIYIEINPDVLLEELDNEAVLLSTKNEHYFGLDQSGLSFWKLLQEHQNSNLVIDALLLEYEVEENTLRQDLARFVSELEKANLIEVRENPSKAI